MRKAELAAKERAGPQLTLTVALLFGAPGSQELGSGGAMQEPASRPLSVVHTQLTHEGYKSQNQSLKVSCCLYKDYSNLL